MHYIRMKKNLLLSKHVEIFPSQYETGRGWGKGGELTSFPQVVMIHTHTHTHTVTQLVEALRYKSEGRGFDFRWCHWNFSLTYFFRPHYGSGVDSASNRNEYQECFLGGKGGRCLGLQPYHLHGPIVLKSGSLNLLEPSGPV